jgi:subfamily B ATP-binding cassette protein MsbA
VREKYIPIPIPTFVKILGYAKPYSRLLWIAILCLVVVSTLSMWMPFALKLIIDDVLINRNYSLLYTIIISLLGVNIIRILFRWNADYLFASISHRIIFDIRLKLYKKVLGLSYDYFSNQSSGKIVSRVFNDVVPIQQLLIDTIANIFVNLFSLVVILILIFIVNWKLALISISLLPLYGFTFYRIRQKSRYLAKNIQEKTAQIVGGINEDVSGIKMIKIMGLQRKRTRLFSRKLHDFYYDLLDISMQGTKSRVTAEFLVGLGPLVVMLFGGLQALNGSITIGGLMSFYTLLMSLLPLLNNLTTANVSIQQGLVAAERYYELMDIAPEKTNGKKLKPLEFKGKIEFRNLDFSYTESNLILKGIDLIIEPGETVALVGPSGAGKSTIVNLLACFYNPTKGDILIDGVNLRDIDLAFWRNNIGIVLQDPFLFEGSVTDNIQNGKPHAREYEIQRAAELANAHEFILDLPNGYQTEIGERGVKLSGGQKQRIAIAMNILRDPAILILDEATSSLDSSSEAIIKGAIDSLIKDKTTIIIAHRLSTIIYADKIIVLEKGEIVGVGTHQSLMNTNLLYRHLYKTQFKNKDHLNEENEYETNEYEKTKEPSFSN